MLNSQRLSPQERSKYSCIAFLFFFCWTLTLFRWIYITYSFDLSTVRYSFFLYQAFYILAFLLSIFMTCNWKSGKRLNCCPFLLVLLIHCSQFLVSLLFFLEVIEYDPNHDFESRLESEIAD